MLRTLAVAVAALALLPASASAGGLAVSLVPGYADPITGKRWTAHLLMDGCTTFDYFGVDPAAPRLEFRHVRSGKVVRVTLHVDRSVVRPTYYPQQERYLAMLTLPRAGAWRVQPVVTRHARDTFGFDVRARRPARL
jgi:hypothetical protein